MDGKADVQFCLFFDCPEHVMESRLLKRGETSGRADDNRESIKKRFMGYQRETMPIIESFKSKGLLRHVIADRSKDEVFAEASTYFK